MRNNMPELVQESGLGLNDMQKKQYLKVGVALLAVSQLTGVAMAKPSKSDASDQAVMDATAAEGAAASAGDPAPEAYGSPNPFAEFEKFAMKRPLIVLPTPEPARLLAAQQLMTKLMPAGTNRRILQVANDTMLQPVFDKVWSMTGAELADLFGVPAPTGKEATETMAEGIGRNDPHAKERINAYIKTYIDITGDMGATIEPDLSLAMARDYARKYDLAQLTEMNRFFATPAGGAFAKDFMLSSFSLDVLQTTLMVMPKLMKDMPAYTKRWEETAKAFPPPRSSGYSGGELPECAKDGDTADCSDEDKSAAEIYNSLDHVTSAEMGDEPWYLEENWSKPERKKYKSASKVYQAASAKSDTAYGKMDTIQQAAIEKARARYKAEGWKPVPVEEPMAAEDIPANAVPPPAIPPSNALPK
jgi:hypothetical protein